jgi:hypothetical protein
MCGEDISGWKWIADDNKTYGIEKCGVEFCGNLNTVEPFCQAPFPPECPPAGAAPSTTAQGQTGGPGQTACETARPTAGTATAVGPVVT